jgi:RNA polymerase-binding transcription factor DksA
MTTEAVAETLRARLDTLMRREAAITRDLRASHAADWTEQALERENDPVLERLDTATRGEVEAIRQALARIEAGRYGVCEVCEEPIADARLRALPTATVCLGCQDRLAAQAGER